MVAKITHLLFFDVFGQPTKPTETLKTLLAEFLRISWSSCCSFWSSSRWDCSWRNSWQVRSEVPVDIHTTMSEYCSLCFFVSQQKAKCSKSKNWKLHYLWSTPAWLYSDRCLTPLSFGVSVEIWELFLSEKKLFLTLWELLEKAQTSRIFWETLRALAKDCEKRPKLVQDVFFVNHQSFS